MTASKRQSVRPEDGTKGAPQTLDFLRVAVRKAFVFTGKEISAWIVLLIVRDNDTNLVNALDWPDDWKLSIPALARFARLSKSSFLRAVEVLELAGLVARHAQKKKDAKGKPLDENDYTTYRLHPQRLDDWIGKERPPTWGELPMEAPSTYHDLLEQLREQAGLPEEDAAYVPLLVGFTYADRDNWQLVKAKRRLRELGPKVERRSGERVEGDAKLRENLAELFGPAALEALPPLATVLENLATALDADIKQRADDAKAARASGKRRRPGQAPGTRQLALPAGSAPSTAARAADASSARPSATPVTPSTGSVTPSGGSDGAELDAAAEVDEPADPLELLRAVIERDGNAAAYRHPKTGRTVVDLRRRYPAEATKERDRRQGDLVDALIRHAERRRDGFGARVLVRVLGRADLSITQPEQDRLPELRDELAKEKSREPAKPGHDPAMGEKVPSYLRPRKPAR